MAPPIWKTMLYLASKSEIRRTLIENAGIEIRIVDTGFDEEREKSALGKIGAKELAQALAAGKAAKARDIPDHALVLGADQTLCLKREIFSKPRNMDDALKQLKTLRGRTHKLHAAISCWRNGQEVWRTCDTAHLTMRKISDQWLEDYLSREGGAILTSVGSYKLERRGVQLFERIEGDYFTILGLPLLPLLAFLREAGEIA
jgi:septum formation protein